VKCHSQLLKTNTQWWIQKFLTGGWNRYRDTETPKGIHHWMWVPGFLPGKKLGITLCKWLHFRQFESFSSQKWRFWLLTDKNATLSDCVTWLHAAGRGEVSIHTSLWIRLCWHLQGSVATNLGCGGIFNDHCIVNELLSVSMKELWKSVNICWVMKLWHYGPPCRPTCVCGSRCVCVCARFLVSHVNFWYSHGCTSEISSHCLTLVSQIAEFCTLWMFFCS